MADIYQTPKRHIGCAAGLYLTVHTEGTEYGSGIHKLHTGHAPVYGAPAAIWLAVLAARVTHCVSMRCKRPSFTC